MCSSTPSRTTYCVDTPIGWTSPTATINTSPIPRPPAHQGIRGTACAASCVMRVSRVREGRDSCERRDSAPQDYRPVALFPPVPLVVRDSLHDLSTAHPPVSHPWANQTS